MKRWISDKLGVDEGMLKGMAERESAIIIMIDFKSAHGNKTEDWPHLCFKRELWDKVEPDSPEEVLNSALVAGFHITDEYKESFMNLMETERQEPERITYCFVD